jgi:ribonucleoside-diphosphate reductase beta chain
MKRYTIFPIQNPDLWKFHKDHQQSQWVAEDIDLSEDKFDSLNPNEQYFIKHVLAFFAASDGIVNENLVLNFASEVGIPEAEMFYGTQIFNENVHSETYSLLIEKYISDSVEKERLFDAINNFPAVEKKAEWALNWINNDASLAEKLIAFICVEGIFFSGSFCAIYWLQHRNLPLPGLTKANEWISRDESTHCDFAIHLYKNYFNTLSKDVIKNIILRAVEVEKEFITSSLPVSLVGMNNDLMSSYVEYVADDIMDRLIGEKEFNTLQPFPFMYKIALDKKTNFFERKVGEYVKPTGNITFDDMSF